MTNLMILHINKRLFVVTAFLVGVLAIGLVVIFPPRSVRSHKSISMVEGINESETLIQTKDFPERGIYLIAPSSPSFVKMAAQLMKSKEGSAADLPPYSVFLKNTGSHSVVGYSITWECVDKKGDTSHKEVSNIISYLFLYGDESDRSKALANEAGVIRPNSTWFISPDLPARRVEGVGEGQMEESTLISQPVQRMDLSKEFSKVTISLDGL